MKIPVELFWQIIKQEFNETLNNPVDGFGMDYRSDELPGVSDNIIYELMSKHKSRIRIVSGQRMKLSMRHRILIGSSVAACLTFLIGLSVNISDSEKAVAGNKSEMITAKPVSEKSGAFITMKRPYPNPFVGFFHFEFTTSSAFKGELNLLNSAGQEIKKINVQAEPGLNSIEVINDCDMKPGIYYAILTTNNKKYVQRLEKN